MRRVRLFLTTLLLALALGSAPFAWSQDPSRSGPVPTREPQQKDQPLGSGDLEQLEQIKQQVQALQAHIQELEKRLSERPTKETPAAAEGQAIEERVSKMEEANVKAGNQIQSLWDRSNDLLSSIRSEVPWGTHNFVVTGFGSGQYGVVPSGNTFGAALSPILLYSVRPNVLFEGELELGLERSEETGESVTKVGLEYAQIDWMAHRYATLVFGKYLNPFGDFIERRHPSWINPLVSFPLPLREGDEGGLLTFTDLGFQVRGAIPVGSRGRSFEYTVFTGNGPAFASGEIGASMADNFADNNHNKSLGARFGVWPVPFTSKLGRLKLGYSTWNGKWDNPGRFWFHSNGVDFTYQISSLDLRGEYIHTTRRTDLGPDTRSGWYAQAAYGLKKLSNPFLNKLEPVYRISFQDEPGSHQRQHAIGLDYWITPFVVWKLEYDRQRLGTEPFYKNALLTQLAFGF